MPALSDGPLMGAFHGPIQTAYGVVGKSPQVVIEGLATFFQQYSPYFPEDPDNPKKTDLTKFGHGKTDLMSTLEILRNTEGQLSGCQLKSLIQDTKQAD